MFKKIFWIGLFLTVFSMPGVANQPPKEIKIIVQYAPGGTADRIARIIESQIDKKLYRVKVEYKLGAGGGIGHSYVAGLKDPGETVLMPASTSLVSLPVMNPETNTYDPATDFIAVAHLGIAPSLVVVNSQTGIQNWQDFIAYTKTRPVSYGSSGIGGSGHIVSALIGDEEKRNFVHIPYKGPAVTDLLGGQITFITDAVGVVDPYIKSGKLVPVAVSNPNRIYNYKNVPTLQEVKINDHHYYRWLLLVANQGADPAILQYINTLVKSTEFRRELANLEMDPVDNFNSSVFLKNEKKKFLTIAKQLNLKPNDR